MSSPIPASAALDRIFDYDPDGPFEGTRDQYYHSIRNGVALLVYGAPKLPNIWPYEPFAQGEEEPLPFPIPMVIHTINDTGPHWWEWVPEPPEPWDETGGLAMPTWENLDFGMTKEQFEERHRRRMSSPPFVIRSVSGWVTMMHWIYHEELIGPRDRNNPVHIVQ